MSRREKLEALREWLNGASRMNELHAGSRGNALAITEHLATVESLLRDKAHQSEKPAAAPLLSEEQIICIQALALRGARVDDREILHLCDMAQAWLAHLRSGAKE